jgi:uncharacterized protein (DUF1778 family)
VKKKPHKSRVRKPYIQHKQTTAFEARQKVQAYIEQSDKELIQRAVDITGSGTISGFAAKAILKEAQRVIDEHESSQAPKKIAR